MINLLNFHTSFQYFASLELGVGPGVVLSSHWRGRASPVVSGVSVPCRVRFPMFFLYLVPAFSSQNTRRHQESRSVTLTVHAHFTFPDLPTLMGIQCGSWTLPIPTVGSYGAASSRPLVLLPSAYAANHAGNPPPLCSLVLQRQWPGSFIFHCSSLCLLR